MLVWRKQLCWIGKTLFWVLLGFVLGPMSLTADQYATYTTDTLQDDGSDYSLRTLVERSSWGDVIVLGVPGTITLTDQIVVNHDLTITAVGAPRDYLISGNNNSRIFHVTTGVFPVRGPLPPLGSGDYFAPGPMPTLTISNLTLLNGNLKEKESGGAIFALDANLNLSACLLTSNHAVEIVSFGGAVGFAGGGVFKIDSCTFSENDANVGGALALSGSSPGSVISRSTFSKNLAVNEGGAMNLNYFFFPTPPLWT